MKDDVAGLHQQIYNAVYDRFDNLYVNPVGVILVPHGHTSVAIDLEDLDDLVTVNVRAPILQDLRRTPDLIEYVAFNATRFRLGSLYLFQQGDLYDLTIESRTVGHWMSGKEVADLVGVLGATAEETASILRPHFGGTLVNESGTAAQRIYAEKEMAENKVVADALVAALDAQRTIIMGAAQGAWMTPGDAVLGRVVFAMTATDLWLAGWPRHAAEPAVWCFPYREISEDRVRNEDGATDYFARVAQGRWLGVRMIDPQAADAMAQVRVSQST